MFGYPWFGGVTSVWWGTLSMVGVPLLWREYPLFSEGTLGVLGVTPVWLGYPEFGGGSRFWWGYPQFCGCTLSLVGVPLVWRVYPLFDSGSLSLVKKKPGVVPIG